jgi:type VI secretion system protein ImpB
LKEHHHNGDALLGTQVVVLGRHGNTLHEVLHLLLETAVPCVLTNDIENDLSINLQFKSINDFGPDAIARQVPEMNKLLELRNALVALKGPLGNTPAFRKQLQSLLADDASRQRLIRELNLTLPAPKDSPDA